MSETRDFEAMLVEQLPFIERMAAKYCRQGGMSREETADFTSWAKERLLENDCQKARKFRGEAAFSTFLATVLFTLYRDFQVANRGRWRPSAEARRQGPVVVALERLVYRDGNTFDEALQILRSRGETLRPERELRAAFQALPRENRGRPRQVGEPSLALVASGETADSRLIDFENTAEHDRLVGALREAMALLDPEDAVIVHMKFFEGASVANIGRTLGVEQKPLYRLIERALKMLRLHLEAAGVSREDILEMLREIKK